MGNFRGIFTVFAKPPDSNYGCRRLTGKLPQRLQPARPRSFRPLAPLRSRGQALEPSPPHRFTRLDRPQGQIRRRNPERLLKTRPQVALQVHDAGERERRLRLARHRPSLADHALRQLRKIRSRQTQEISLTINYINKLSINYINQPSF